MSTYAKIGDNSVVLDIAVADSDWIGLQNGTWVEYFESNPAFIGGTYNFEKQYFKSPQPEGAYIWDEETLAWVPLNAG